MGVKTNAFASRSERDNYYKLQRAWGNKYHIFHNIPFLNLFTIENLIDFHDWQNLNSITLTELEISQLKKTSIDYTLCDEKDTPILCIEFDGMQQGYNVGADYYPDKVNLKLNPWRRHITELKLKVAHGSMFPYFVVGSKYFKDVPAETNLTIVDGIVGEVLSLKATNAEINSFSPEKLGMTEDEFDHLSDFDKHEFIQDWVFGVEIEMDIEHNPITRRLAQLEFELEKRGKGIYFLNYPPFEPGDTEGFKNVILIGSRVVYTTEDYGDVEGLAWLPNFNAPGYGLGISLCENIASLYALERLKLMRDQKK